MPNTIPNTYSTYMLFLNTLMEESVWGFCVFCPNPQKFGKKSIIYQPQKFFPKVAQKVHNLSTVFSAKVTKKIIFPYFYHNYSFYLWKTSKMLWKIKFKYRQPQKFFLQKRKNFLVRPNRKTFFRKHFLPLKYMIFFGIFINNNNVNFPNTLP